MYVCTCDVFISIFYCLYSLSSSALVTDKVSFTPFQYLASSLLPSFIKNTVYNFPLLNNDFTLFFFSFLSFQHFLFEHPLHTNEKLVTSTYKMIHIKGAENAKLQKNLVDQNHSYTDYGFLILKLFIWLSFSLFSRPYSF